jgi:glyoxylase-like metal-dependent hydrolase (beta-lactamase superfamily II)
VILDVGAAAHAPLAITVVAPGIWSVEMALPALLRRTSRTYLVDGGAEGVAVIDPAWPLDENQTRLREALTAIGRRLNDITLVFSTHAHLDHFGLAGHLRRLSGARVLLHRNEQTHVRELTYCSEREQAVARAEAWGVPHRERERLLGGASEHLQECDVVIDTWCEDTDVVDWGDRGWRVVSTPGHTSGSACLVHHGRRLLFTGDTLLPGQSPGLGMGGQFEMNPLTAFMDSLTVLTRFDGYLVLPGHGLPFRRVADEVTMTLAHHTNRQNQVAAALAEARGTPSVWELAQSVGWRGGFESLKANRLRSALRHVEIYGQMG